MQMLSRGLERDWLLSIMTLGFVATRCGAQYSVLEREARSASRRMVRADQPFYEFRTIPAPSVTITVTVTNTSRRPVYLPRGGAGLLALERQVEGRWVPAVRPIRTMELGQPATIQPGATVRDTVVLDLRGGVSPPQSPSEVAGTYRAVYAIFATWDARGAGGPPGDLVPQEERTSNPFTLRLASGTHE